MPAWLVALLLLQAAAPDPDLQGMPPPPDPDLQGMPPPPDPDLQGMPPPPDPDLQGMPPPPPDTATPGASADPDLGAMPAPPAAPAFSTAFSPTVRVAGHLRLEAAFDTQHDREGEDVVETRERFDLELSARATPELSARVAGRMSHDARAPELDFDGARAAYEPELRDAYATAHLGATLVTVGNQVIRWGVVESNSPNDVINPVDYRDGLKVDLETPHVPVLAAQVTHTVTFDASMLTFEGVYVPFFVPHRAPLFGNDWAPVGSQPQLEPLLALLGTALPPASQEDVQPLMLSLDPPDESPRNGSGGARVGWSDSGLDLHLNAFYGWDRVPELHLDPALPELLVALRENDLGALARLFPELRADLDAGELPFTSRYHRQLVIGADAVVVAGDFALRADVAWTPARTLYTEALQAERTPALSWAGGVEWLPDSDLQLTVEAFGLLPLDEAPAGTDWFLVGEHFANLVGVVRWTLLDDDLTLQVATQYGLTRHDWIVAPRVSWRFVENNEARLGALLLDGPEESAGGVFDANDHVYAQYAWSF